MTSALPRLGPDAAVATQTWGGSTSDLPRP